MDIILYTTGCPRCHQLEKVLEEKGVAYTKETSVDKMLGLGFLQVPILEVDGKRMDYQEAVEWAMDL